MLYILSLFFLSLKAFADLSPDLNLFTDESGAGITPLDLTSNDGPLASLPESDINPFLNKQSSYNLFPPDNSDLDVSLSNNNDGELSMKDCSTLSPQSRRTRKRTAECNANTLDNPGNLNPSVELPTTTNSVLDLSQEGFKKKWCSETTSLVFGNIPVCAVVALENPITKFFENVESYLMTWTMSCPSGQIWCCQSWQEYEIYRGVIPWNAVGLGYICVFSVQLNSNGEAG